MYNENQKKQFILSYTQSAYTAKNATSLFNIIEEFERKWDADICTKDGDELPEVLSKIVGLRLRSNDSRLSILRSYGKWCRDQQIPGACDGLENIKEVGLNKVKEQTVPDPWHLQEYLDVICDPEEKQTTDNIVRCYCWLAYSGVEEEDILNIKCSDVDLHNKRINYENGICETEIYDEAIKAFRNCVELDEFMFIHPKFEVPRKRVQGDTLIRGIRDLTTTKSMRVELSRKAARHCDDTDLKLSYKRIRASGIFYRTLINERNGYEPDFKPLVAHERYGKNYNLSHSRNTQEYKLKELELNYMKDYERWKIAWSVS